MLAYLVEAEVGPGTLHSGIESSPCHSPLSPPLSQRGHEKDLEREHPPGEGEEEVGGLV